MKTDPIPNHFVDLNKTIQIPKSQVSKHSASDHFADAGKMVNLGSGSVKIEGMVKGMGMTP